MNGHKTCPGCRRELASNAGICPHCGHKFTGCVTGGLALVLGIGFLLFVVAIFAFSC